MPLISFVGLSFSIPCAIFAVFIFLRSKSKLHHIWALLNVVLFLWGIGLFLVGITHKPETAVVVWKYTHICVMFIPVVFYHLVYIFSKSKKKKQLFIIYLQAFFFVVLISFTKYVIGPVVYLFNSLYYNQATTGYFIMFSIWSVVVCFSLTELQNFIKNVKGLKLVQAKYLMVGALFGFIGGASTALPAFGVMIYPIGHFGILIYVLISMYAIFKYQLMDIKVAVTRLGVFVFVYSLVLGIPFGLVIWQRKWLIHIAGEYWFWIPMIAVTVLATIGPFFFIYFQRRTEAKLLAEERRIQDLLKKASIGMSAVRDVEKLSKLIIDVISQNLRIDYTALYLIENRENKYSLRISEPQNERALDVNDGSPLIKRLKEKSYPILADEINHLLENQNGHNSFIKGVKDQLEELSAQVVVPALKGKNLIGFIVLGKRNEKDQYTSELLDVLSIVGNDAAVNIENALFTKAENERIENEGAHARRKNLDTMVSTMSHQIASPLNSIKLDLALFEEILTEEESVNPQLKKLLMQRINNTSGIVTHISKIIQSIKEYSRGQIKYENISVEELMILFGPIKNSIGKENPGAIYKEEIEKNLPLIYGDKSMLMEILGILLDNAHQALIYREGEKLVKLNIRLLNGNYVRFEVIDNGYGINNEVREKLFESIYTSKPAGKGTGMGLRRIRTVCELMEAKYGFDSEGEGKGARFWVDVKVAKESKANGGN